MKAQLTQREFDLFRDFIERNCGIALRDDKRYLVETRLAGLVSETGSTSFADFYRKLDRNPAPRLRNQIIDAMTTNETLWFRDGSPWVAMRDHILPELERKANGKQLRIWSAACSTGQEPYSMAMLIDHYASLPRRHLSPDKVQITATDISPSALMVAKMGRYDGISMRRGFAGEWAGFRDKYFTRRGVVSEIKPQLRQRIEFQQFNLQDRLARLGRFDVVFLRNVAIYFSEEFKSELFGRIAQILNPGGLLLLGTAETTHGYTKRFETVTLGRAIAYRVLP